MSNAIYRESSEGVFWIDPDTGRSGEPQKDLHHAMKDYERDQRDRASGILAGESEEAHTDAAEGGAGSTEGGGGSEDDSDPGHGDPAPEGADGDQVGREAGPESESGSLPPEDAVGRSPKAARRDRRG